MEISLNSRGYTSVIVQKNIPVIFNIKVENVENYACTNIVNIPSLNITKELQNGDNIIEFTPTKEGNITYSCWMGMVRSTIKIVNDLKELN